MPKSGDSHSGKEAGDVHDDEWKVVAPPRVGGHKNAARRAGDGQPGRFDNLHNEGHAGGSRGSHGYSHERLDHGHGEKDRRHSQQWNNKHEGQLGQKSRWSDDGTGGSRTHEGRQGSGQLLKSPLISSSEAPQVHDASPRPSEPRAFIELNEKSKQCYGRSALLSMYVHSYQPSVASVPKTQ